MSKTPGRTQQINYFALGSGRYLVDLPGYGYAKVPAEVQRAWGHLLSHYLQTRSALQGLVVIMDVRHPMTPLDRQLLDWFALTGKPVLILLTKADKLSRQQATTQLRKVRSALEHYPECRTELFSSVSGQGVDQARAFVETLLTATEPGAQTPADACCATAEKEKPPVKGDKPGVKP